MTWVIAILLGLILVALISSNQAAAAGVGKVVHFVLLSAAMFIAWMVLIGYSVWYYETYPKGDWERIIGIACFAIIPPFLVWLYRKNMWSVYRDNKKAAFKFAAGLVGYLVVFLAAMPVYQEMRANNEHIGWTILLVTFGLTGSVLLFRSFNGTTGWKEVWNGPPSLPEPWEVVSDERDVAWASEVALWEAFQVTRDDMTYEQANALTNAFESESEARKAATEQRIEALRKKLEAEKVERAKQVGRLSVAGVFWWSVILSTFGLIGIAWDYGFDYAMGLEFVKGRAWMAGAVVIGGGFLLVGAIASFAEEIGKYGTKRDASTKATGN